MFDRFSMEEDWRRVGGGLEEDWRRIGGGLGAFKMAGNSENDVLRFLILTPIISAFQAFSCISYS